MKLWKYQALEVGKLWFCVVLTLQSPAFSQSLAPAPAVPSDPGTKPLPRLPESLPPPRSQPPFETLPILPPELPSGLPEVTVMVQRIEIIGSTVFSPDELQREVAAFLHKPAAIQDLLAARAAITDLYVRQGYLTSGGFLPAQAQDFVNGVIRIQVIEGELEAVEVLGLSQVREGYVRSRLVPSGTRPANIRKLEENLQLLQLDPLFRSIRAELKAGSAIGRSILSVELTEATPWQASLTLDNQESPSVGSTGIYGILGNRNLTGWGDLLSADIGVTEGTRKYGLRYELPLNARDELLLRYSYETSRIIESPFADLGINSRSQSASLGFRHFLWREPSRELSVGLSLDWRESRSFFLEDIPFSFTVGPEDGRSTVSVLRFNQEWIERGVDRVLAARSQLNWGLGFLGATVNDTGTDSRFLSWQGQAQWVQSLAKDTIAIARFGAQLTGSSLLALEQFGIGGRDTVRGYRQNLFVGDSGVVGSLEVRLPVLRSADIGLVQLAPFFDIGRVWNNRNNAATGNTLSSVGLGLRWEVNPNLRGRLEWAIPLTANSNVPLSQSLLFSLQITGF